VEEVREASKGENPDHIRTKIQELQQETMKIGSNMQGGGDQSSQGEGGGGSSEGGEQKEERQQ
jgi:uncharacterized membrane protein YgcG